MLTTHPLRTIAVVVFDGISPFHISVPCMVFGDHSDLDGMPKFTLRVCALSWADGPHLVATNEGFSMHTKYGYGALEDADMIVIPSWGSDNAPPDLLSALQRAHARGAIIAGLCLGAFVLAEAGLLDGREATTHWELADEFSQAYPNILINHNVLYVDHGDVVTSAGTAAAIDCCLQIVRRHYGSDVAASIARRMVVAPHRQGGQAQYIERPMPTLASDDRLSQVIQWMQENLTQSHNTDALAERALMSRRTFTRAFQKHTGTSVTQWVLNQRLVLAQRMLESTNLSVESIAHDCGFGSALVLRRNFMSHLQTTPSQYRREFHK